MTKDMVPIETSGDWPVPASPFALSVSEAAKMLGAVPSQIPGLWYLEGYPELTSNQLLSLIPY